MVWEPLEFGREALGVRGLLALRAGPIGDGKVSPDITSKESSRSDMTSGLAGLTRTSLGPLRDAVTCGARLEELGPKDEGTAASIEGRVDMMNIRRGRHS